MRSRSAASRSGLLLTAAIAGCATGCASMAAPPKAPSSAARCSVGASQTSVLVTEWPAGEKANLEALLKGPALAVEFSGCELRVLPECHLKGSYVWQRTTPSTDAVEIDNELDLYTKLPLGAVALGGELAHSGSLTVETTVAGQLRLQGMTASEVTSTPECARATHIVDGLSLGAFTLSSAGRASGGGSVGVYGMGGGVRASQSRRILSQAGNRNACSTASDGAAPQDCASPIEVFLAPIPGRAEPEGPPGSVKVDFESADPGTRWDVYVNDQATCTTPCSRWVDPNRPVSLRTRDDYPSTVQVKRLDATRGPLGVSARPTSKGELLTGMTFTSLGGLGFLGGVTMTSVGCATSNRGLCVAGLVTTPLTGALTAASIWMMLDAKADTKVTPLFQTGPVTAAVGPGFVFGKF